MATFQDEPSVFEVFHPLFIRWKLLLGGILLSVLIAAVVTSVLPKRYETTLLLQVGTIMDRQLEDSDTVVDIINSDSFLQTVAARLKLDASPRQLSKMIHADTNAIPGRQSPLVNVTLLSDSPDGAVRLAKEVFAVLDERHKPLFDAQMEYYNGYSNLLKQKVNSYDQELSSLKRDRDLLESDPKVDLSGKILLQTKINDRETQILTANRELQGQLAYTAAVHSHPTNMVASPVVPRKPAKPSIRLNLLIAFFTGSFVMVSFILIMDQYRKASLRI